MTFNAPLSRQDVLLGTLLKAHYCFRIKDQPTFPNFSRDHAHQFLHACYWNPIKAKKALQNYCEIRANSPALFENRDPMSDSFQTVLSMTLVMFFFLKKMGFRFHLTKLFISFLGKWYPYRKQRPKDITFCFID